MEHLIPDEFFVNLAAKHISLIFLLTLVSFAMLYKGADWFVEGSVSIAKKLGIPKVIIGATIVSIGTTSAEAAVSVMAAFSGQAGLALGNGIGSVICDTALIFGLCCCITKLPADKFILRRHGWVQVISGIGFAVLCYFLLWTGKPSITRPLGLVLLGGLGLYIVASVKWAKQHDGYEVDDIMQTGNPVARAILFFVGLLLIIIGSRILIGSVQQICLRFGVPQAVIAATLVAFGTSLPELATAIACIAKGHKDMLIGNILGADILNILFVIGAASCASTLVIPDVMFRLHLPALIIVLIVFRIFASTSKENFSRWMGAPLLVLYVLYIYVQYF